ATTTYTLFPYTTLFRSFPPVKEEAGVPLTSKSLSSTPETGSEKVTVKLESANTSPEGGLMLKMRGGTLPASARKLKSCALKPKRSEEHTSELQSHLNLV